MSGCCSCGPCTNEHGRSAHCTDGCTGVAPVTPRRAGQRPGLPGLEARIGTHGDFLASMVARLAAHRQLDGLTARTADDPSIAMLDCWAVVADTVTFYTERALEEGYLGTARRGESVTRLARLLGHRPRPPLASSGHLSFTLDPGQAGPVPAGTSAQSIPGPGEHPQTFETSGELEASAEWNRLAVRTTRPPAVLPWGVDDLEELVLVGSSLNLRAGDKLVFDFGSADVPRVREVATVAPDHQAERTTVSLVPRPGHPAGADRALHEVGLWAEWAAQAAQTPFQKEVGELLAAAAGDLGEGSWEVLPALATLRRVAAEARALATAGRLSAADESWVATYAAPLAEAVGAATPLATAQTRERSPELAYLEALATEITCPGGGEDEGRQRRAECAQGAPLLAAASALAALRRPPARPPASAASSPEPLDSVLAPGSAGLVDLLAGGDPALRDALAIATATLPLAGPRRAARIVALRTRTNPVPEGRDDGAGADRRVVVDGLRDDLVVGGWIVSRERSTGDDEPRELVTRIAGVQHFVRSVWVGDSSAAVRVPGSVVTTAEAVLPHDGDVDLDDITLWFGDQPLALADQPVTEPVRGGEIELAQPVPGLAPGRLLVVSGERCDVPGVTGVRASEVVMVGAVQQRVDLDLPGDLARPVLVLAVPLSYEYVRQSVAVHGNVVAATQGQTRAEVLGSGDPSIPGQAFGLRQPTEQAPLTRLPSVTGTGAESTLEVRVDDVRWHPTRLLADAGDRDRVYAMDEGPGPAVSVRFGDGRRGARLPRGVENVAAAYRVGGGPSGNVGADRVTQLTSRPLGVSAVTNPLPMTGGTRGDSALDTREVAPLRTLALDRLVSVADHAHFASARPGIAKAAAARLHDGGRELVHLTVAAVDDAPLAPGDLLLTSLERSLAEHGDPTLPVVVDVRRRTRLVLSAGLSVHPDHRFDDVAARVRARLLEELGFDRARLGAPVHVSRVVAVVQATPGVEHVDVDTFGGLSEDADPVRLLREVTALSGVADTVPARAARVVRGEYEVGDDPTGWPETLSTVALRHGLALEQLVALNPRLRTVPLAPGDRLVVRDGPAPAELACFDPEQPRTIVLRRIP